MKAFSFFWYRELIFIIMILFIHLGVSAQNWMTGYNYRKKITIDKSKVAGNSTLINFPVLIEFEDEDLKYIPGCESHLSNSRALDISFALVNQSSTPMSFQLDSYDPVAGRLTCWLRFPELIANGKTGVNEVYFYYGANKLHDPASPEAKSTWSDAGYQKVWHMNLDVAPSISLAANHSPGNDAVGSPGMGSANFPFAKIGRGILLNGLTESMYSGKDTNTVICVTAWIKIKALGVEQIILANDSTTGGYRIKLDASGNLILEALYFSNLNSSVSGALSINTWYHFAFVFNKGIRRLYLNGELKGGGGALDFKLGRGAFINIGKSKLNNRYFNGVIDELRIQNVERTADWILTEYRNQENPNSFILVGATEVNPLQTSIENIFTGAAGTDNWNDGRNWSYGKQPENFSNLTIGAGKHLRLGPETRMVINKLTLKPDAIFSLGADLVVSCNAVIGTSATVVLDEGIKMELRSDVINEGSIALSQSTGILQFSGNQILQTFSGSGTTTVSDLEVNRATSQQILLLQTELNISRQVQLTRGTLSSNGKLTLLSSSRNTAMLNAIQEPGNASIVGAVNVQRFIDGDFLAPSTARGWWLLASPVYQAVQNGIKQFGFHGIQSSIFVTGVGGIVNGFDSSPNNKATIYTHKQALPGTLSQKYVPIPDMKINSPLGSGFYIFSRGNRNIPGAYLHQVQSPPFLNPGSYVITYVGELHIGDLTVPLFNKDTGAEGDGYNLLGNPYASAITWAGLQKTNVGPFIWVFDPRNNAYQVTDDPQFIIYSGTGFFVRVIRGSTTGAVTFKETSKYHPFINESPKKFVYEPALSKPGIVKTKLKLRLSKDHLYDDYTLILSPEGKDEITDEDAPKLGEGYLSISGLARGGEKLSIDHRLSDTIKKEVKLFVKGWTNGTYVLKLDVSFQKNLQVTFVDRYLNVNKRIAEGENIYHFAIDTALSNTYGGSRFSLLFTPFKKAGNDILIYPNPFQEILYIKSENILTKTFKVLIVDVTGRVFFEKDMTLAPGIPSELCCSYLKKGIYILKLTDPNNLQSVSSFKLIKN